MEPTEAMCEVLDKLVSVCQAGRAGRRLDLVGAFAEIEAELIERRNVLRDEIAQAKHATAA